jgi:DNA-3-methyladenine glycosylase
MNLNADADFSDSFQNILSDQFYSRSALDVARDLLGKLLIRRYNGQLLAGVIIEAEAYQGEEDLGCHAKAGLTPRTRIMYGPPGHAYIYFTYGMHWMLNAVTGPEGSPAAVLIRGMEPVYGLDIMRSLRPQPGSSLPAALHTGWTDGPAKLCQALALNGTLNGVNLCDGQTDVWVADAGIVVPEDEVLKTPRIGMNTVPEPWFSIPWRFVWTEV